MNDHLKNKKAEVYDSGLHGTFNTGGGGWGKELGYHIIDTGIEYQMDNKTKNEIIDSVLKDYTKRKEDERKVWKEIIPDGKNREVVQKK